MFFDAGRLQVELEQLSEKGIVGPFRDALEDLLVAQWQIEEGLQHHLSYFAKCAADFRSADEEIQDLTARLRLEEGENAALRESYNKLSRRHAQLCAALKEVVK